MNEGKVVEQPNNIINYLSADMHKDFSKKTKKRENLAKMTKLSKIFRLRVPTTKKGHYFHKVIDKISENCPKLFFTLPNN